MRVVPDPNVVISALISVGTTAAVLDAWLNDEAAKFDHLEKAAEDDADREALIAEKPDRWRPFGRERHNIAAQQYDMDQMDVGFEKQIEGEIASGKIAVPPGGPLTSEETNQAEMHPWPGHTMEETVARMRSSNTGQKESQSGEVSSE